MDEGSLTPYPSVERQLNINSRKDGAGKQLASSYLSDIAIPKHLQEAQATTQRQNWECAVVLTFRLVVITYLETSGRKNSYLST
jgi:hypothetical protein